MNLQHPDVLQSSYYSGTDPHSCRSATHTSVSLSRWSLWIYTVYVLIHLSNPNKRRF